MSELTRRNFVRNGAGAAAGVAAMGTFGAVDADAKKRAKHAEPVVAWLGDPRDGKVTIMSGSHQVTIRDHALAAKLAHHAAEARREHKAQPKHTTHKGKKTR